MSRRQQRMFQKHLSLVSMDESDEKHFGLHVSPFLVSLLMYLIMAGVCFSGLAVVD